MVDKKLFKQGERMSNPREAVLQNEAKKAVAKLLGVKPRDVSTDVESFDPEPPFVVWSCNGHYGHYEDGKAFATCHVEPSQL